MHDIRLVARHEFGRIVGRRSFIILTLAVPLAIILLLGAIIGINQAGNSRDLPIGYVDYSGLLGQARQPEDQISVVAFADEVSATSALEVGEIQAFFVFPNAYPVDRQTALYYMNSPPDTDAWASFLTFVRLNLTAELPPEVQRRLMEGLTLEVKDTASGRTFVMDPNVFLPFIATLLFLIATMSAAGNMLTVVADEKENRTVEVLLTTLRPRQLMAGKSLGLLGVGFAQLVIFVGAAILGLLLVRPFVPDLANMTVDWTFLGVMVIYFIPTYILILAAMIALGAAVTSSEQGQSVSGLLNLLFILPMMLVMVIFQNPNSPVVVFMTLFPTSAFFTISLRWGLGTIPLWQLILSFSLLVVSAIFMLWTAGRIFEIGVLRYGQSLSVRGAFGALRR